MPEWLIKFYRPKWLFWGEVIVVGGCFAITAVWGDWMSLIPTIISLIIPTFASLIKNDIAQRVERFELLEKKLVEMKEAISIDDGKIKASGRDALNRIHDWVVDVCKKGESGGYQGNFAENRFLESFNEWGIEFIKTSYLLWSQIFPPDLYPEELKRFSLRMIEGLTHNESDLLELMEDATRTTRYEGAYLVLYHYAGVGFPCLPDELRGENKHKRGVFAFKIFLSDFVSPTVKQEMRREAEMKDPSRRKNLTVLFDPKNNEVKVVSHEKNNVPLSDS